MSLITKARVKISSGLQVMQRDYPINAQINKKALHTISFTSEMQTLAYIMIFNLYSVRNLMNLSTPRAIFLFDLFTHKEIDICSHIYHIFTKCITKRNTRIILLFPCLVMSLITKARVKIPSGLQVMQRDYPISTQTMTRSKAHILEPSIGVSQIPRDEEGADTEEEIEHFTSILEDTTQPSSQERARALNHLDHLIRRVEGLHGMMASQISHSTSQFTYLEGQITALSS